MAADTEPAALCEPYICAFPDPTTVPRRARWTCPRCGSQYRLTRPKPARDWRTTYAPNGWWRVAWPGWREIVRRNR